MRELIQALILSEYDRSADGMIFLGEKEFEDLKAAFEEEGKAIGMKEEILKAVEKSKLSILRGMHSGDKVAGILTNLVEAVHTKYGHEHISFICPECGHVEDSIDDELAAFERVDGGGGETCPSCGGEVGDEIETEDVFLTCDELKEAEAYVLRIKNIKDSKKKKGKNEADSTEARE